MTRKQVAIVVALAVFVVAAVILLALGRAPGTTDYTTTPDGAVVVPDGEEEEDAIPEYTPEVPRGVEETETNLKLDVESQDGKDTGQELGVYRITAARNGFTPDSLVVTKGDVVVVRFTADGGDYDFFIPAYGFYMSAADGDTAESSFMASASGTFRFECRDKCPSSGKITGMFIVKPQ